MLTMQLPDNFFNLKFSNPPGFCLAATNTRNMASDIFEDILYKLIYKTNCCSNEDLSIGQWILHYICRLKYFTLESGDYVHI